MCILLNGELVMGGIGFGVVAGVDGLDLDVVVGDDGRTAS